jgi:hypothetical protein
MRKFHFISFSNFYKGRSKRWFLNLSLVNIILLFSANAGLTQHHDKHSVGKIDFPISCNSAVKEQFNHALAMLHHMMYDHAGKEFNKITELDPGCAMAYWGIAMSYFHPLWHEPTKDDLTKGWEAVEKLKN